MYSAFEDRIQIECTGENLKVMIVEDALKRAVSGWESFPPHSPLRIVMANLPQLLGRTKGMTFGDGLSEDEQALQAFWQFASISTDYKAIWDQFVFLAPEVHNEWWNAIKAKDEERARLLAPVEVREGGAPDDDPVKKNGSTTTKKRRIN